MKKYLSLFAVALIVGAFFVQPVRAETNPSSMQALIQSLMAQVQELQRQLVILQDQAGGSNATPSITVLYPNGGETLKFGTMIDIVWTAPNITKQQQYFDLYVQTVGADANKRFLLNSAIPMDGTQTKQTYEWEVGTQGAAGAAIPLGYYYMEVCPWSHGEYSKPPCDRSNETFRITNEGPTTPDYIKVTNPNGGEVLYTGKTARITWDKRFDGKDGRVSIALRSECPMISTSIMSGVIVSDTGNTGEYVWKVPSRYANDKCGYKVRIATIPGTTAYMVSDESNDWFEIQLGQGTVDESIDVFNPVGGERYIPGQAISVGFDVRSPDGKPDVAIKLYKTTGDKETIVNEVYYSYEDGFVHNGENKIKFYPAKGSNYSDDELVGTFRIEVLVGEIFCCKPWIEPTDSDMTGEFSISSNPTPVDSIKVISPNGGEVWHAGSTHTITWSSANLSSDRVTIRLASSCAGGWPTIVQDTSDDGSYTWNIPSTYASTICKYKIEVGAWYDDGEGPDVYDFSDGWFQIVRSYTLPPVVLGASASYQDVLSQMANTLKGMQELLQGLK
ncbi:MAG: GPI anchored serine-threonine rich family protein [Candidatus Campbellbacteria bacterium]|nr:GPI anchored serine-threonine rich family protein [Candidatus Campbellbacteria bacterium]